MSKSRTYRPVVADRLEDRTVPSGMGFFGGGGIADVPSQDARQVISAFHTLERSFRTDFNTYLSAVKAGTSSAGSTFTTAISTDLGTLTSSVDEAIANLAATNPSLKGSVDTALNTLQTELTTLTPPSSTSHKDASHYLNQAFRDINQTLGQVAGQIRSATPPVGSISTSTFNQVVSKIESSFRTFVKSYNSAITNSATKPSTDRAAFDAAVGTALNTLNTSLTQAVSTLPSSVSSSLGTQFSNDILNSGGSSSLQTRLSNITTPSSSFFSTWGFRLRSYRSIGIAESQVFQQLTTAVHDFNANLS